MYVKITTLPMRTATLRSFTSSHPWTGEPEVTWQLALYLMVQEGQAFPGSGAVRRAIARNAKHGLPPTRALRGNELLGLLYQDRFHLVPRALMRLWAAGRVRDEDLPTLVHDLATTLRRMDYPSRDSGRTLAFFGLFFVAAAIAALIATRAMDNAYWSASLFPLAPFCGVIALIFFAFAGYLRGRDANLTRRALDEARDNQRS